MPRDPGSESPGFLSLIFFFSVSDRPWHLSSGVAALVWVAPPAEADAHIRAAPKGLAMTPTTCLHHLFEAQALATPDSPAVRFEGERLTYAELNRRADLLAAHLRSMGAVPDARIGLLVDRSADAIVGILGTLKAGAAYVPIDPAYPADRMARIL